MKRLYDVTEMKYKNIDRKRQKEIEIAAVLSKTAEALCLSSNKCCLNSQ